MALKSAYDHYKLVISKNAGAAGGSVQNEDQEMEDHKESPEAIRQKILNKYKDILAKDKRTENVEQNPVSRAYSSTCSLTTQKELSKEEADIS